MKKLPVYIFVMAIALIVFLAGCGGSKNESSSDTGSIESTESTQSTVSEPQKTTFAMGETAVFNKLKITADEIKESNGKQYFEPAEGKIFVGVKFTIENIAEEDINISSVLLFNGYVDDVSVGEYSVSAGMAFDESLDGTIAKGKKLVGWYSAEVPKDWKQLQIDFKPDMLSESRASFIINK